MPVPGQWESSALPGFNGIVLMQREIDIPAGWAGKPVELHLGAIDDEDVTYFNGTKIAEGSGYNVERTYTVPAELVKGGKALITVRVTDFEGEGGICGSASDLFARQGDSRLPLDGNWTYKVAADFGKLPRRPVSAESASFPTVLYNAMLYPLRQLPIKGVLWYQGCANVGVPPSTGRCSAGLYPTGAACGATTACRSTLFSWRHILSPCRCSPTLSGRRCGRHRQAR